MAKSDKFRAKLLGGRSDHNIRFAELVAFLGDLGFRERTEGGHFLFGIDGIPGILNLQPDGAMVKAYQVKQVREFIRRNGL